MGQTSFKTFRRRLLNALTTTNILNKHLFGKTAKTHHYIEELPTPIMDVLSLIFLKNTQLKR